MSCRVAIVMSAACLTGMLGGATRDVCAQPAAADKQKAKLAKEYVDAGLAAQEAKDFATAIELYEKAYALVPHPVLLFNIGQAHRLAGRTDQAVAYYEKYLAADPKGPQAATARDLIAEIAAKKAAEEKKREDARKAEEARKAEAARKLQETREAEEAAKAAQARKATETREAREAPEAQDAREPSPEPTDQDGFESHPGRLFKYTGIGVASVGVLGVTASILYGLRAREVSDDLSQPGALYDPAYVAYGERTERNAIICGVAGGALIAGGAALYFLGHKRDAAAVTEHVTLLVRPGVVGLALGGALP